MARGSVFPSGKQIPDRWLGKPPTIASPYTLRSEIPPRHSPPMAAAKLDLYAGRDPRDIPAYTASDAARYLRVVPDPTVRAWCFGQAAPSRGTHFKPVLAVADRQGRLLSFNNLVELFVLASLTRRHRVPLQHVRRLVKRLQERGRSAHPLADATLATDQAGQLFLEEAGHVLNVSAGWQEEMRPIVEQHLSRIERDQGGIPLRLYPFAKTKLDDERPVVIDPRVEFGRPCLIGTGIPVEVLAERWDAGDDIEAIGQDYHRDAHEVQAAIRYLRAAA